MVKKVSNNTFIDTDSGVRFVWNGAHTVNCYHGNQNFDCFSIGDFKFDAATPEQVLQGVRNYVQYSLSEGV